VTDRGRDDAGDGHGSEATNTIRPAERLNWDTRVVRAMTETSDWWLAVPRPVRRLPADLAAVVALVVLTTLAVFVPVVNETPLRVVLGLPLVLFVPGYAFVAALFPEAGSGPTVGGDVGERDDADDGNGWLHAESADADDVTASSRDGGIDGIERVALSFGLSIAIVPLVGLVLNFTPFGIRLVPIVGSIDAFVLAATAVAARRRWALPADERFVVPYRAWTAAAREELLEPDSRGDAALNALLVLSVLLATTSVGYAVAVPKQGEQFTEFYVLTENETGDLVADDYPTEFARGESKPVVVGLQNHERDEIAYTVVIEQQRVALVDNETNVSVLEQRELDRFTVTAADNETRLRNVSLAPEMTGNDTRVVFLLYRGDAPADPTVDDAYRELHLWVNVSAAGNETTTGPSGRETQIPVRETSAGVAALEYRSTPA